MLFKFFIYRFIDFYTFVSYKFDGIVANGDIFTIGLRYKNYSVTVGMDYGSGPIAASLQAVAEGLKAKILADSRYTAIDPLTGVAYANINVSTSRTTL